MIFYFLIELRFDSLDISAYDLKFLLLFYSILRIFVFTNTILYFVFSSVFMKNFVFSLDLKKNRNFSGTTRILIEETSGFGGNFLKDPKTLGSALAAAASACYAKSRDTQDKASLAYKEHRIDYNHMIENQEKINEEIHYV